MKLPELPKMPKLSKSKGSSAKMPTVKVPDFLADLYTDLRERRLLPLIALLAVAIVATPLLLSQRPPNRPKRPSHRR